MFQTHLGGVIAVLVSIHAITCVLYTSPKASQQCSQLPCGQTCDGDLTFPEHRRNEQRILCELSNMLRMVTI